MKFQYILSSLAALATCAPLNDTMADEADLDRRGTASACYTRSNSGCCVDTHCLCADNRRYLLNLENVRKGLHGCDPPWAIVGNSISAFDGYCC
ncbi:hypothetical protein G6O67_008471 [Ophiocordyceps sinensis]|uniref:Uncharacterized protein n=1 Tax=Ophiocordyceps sinensis TaxID=72228 RepID=A0A8H4LRG8_9HYPO|nr:hypothetical protein G6O67_008471 [Ophiocordyceps sinensis]